jgi:hypothetical protein
MNILVGDRSYHPRFAKRHVYVRVRNRSGRQEHGSEKMQHYVSPLFSNALMMRFFVVLCNADHDLWRGGSTSARITPRMALTSRDDQPVFVKIVRSVFFVA